MVTIEQIEKGLASYLDSELMPNLQLEGIQKVLTGTAIGLFIKRSENIVKSYADKPFVKLLGIMDDNGDVDIDILTKELKTNIPEEGVSINVPLLGTMKFHKSDVDVLYKHITGGDNA